MSSCQTCQLPRAADVGNHDPRDTRHRSLSVDGTVHRTVPVFSTHPPVHPTVHEIPAKLPVAPHEIKHQVVTMSNLMQTRQRITAAKQQSIPPQYPCCYNPRYLYQTDHQQSTVDVIDRSDLAPSDSKSSTVFCTSSASSLGVTLTGRRTRHRTWP